jgi:signal transduction histidine kinase
MLTDSLRNAVREPGLRLAYWAPTRQSYVDTGGRPTTSAEPGPGERVTAIVRRGQTIAAIVHSRRVDGPRLERALGPALRLALENTQLRAAALAELDELSRSRTRVVERGELERRRLERNLHDGAQQRVMALALLVRVLAGSSAVDQKAGRRAEALTRTLVEELRRVARGIYPAVLADAGLVGAVVDLAERSGDFPVVVGEFPEGRHPGTVETTAYLVIRAGIADARGRGATSVTVAGAHFDGTLRVSVEDDASSAPDSVVTELADQVGALGGTLVMNGTAGRRRAEVVLPCVW